MDIYVSLIIRGLFIFWLVVVAAGHFGALVHFGFSGLVGYPVAAYGLYFFKNHFLLGLLIAFCLTMLWYRGKEKRAA